MHAFHLCTAGGAEFCAGFKRRTALRTEVCAGRCGIGRGGFRRGEFLCGGFRRKGFVRRSRHVFRLVQKHDGYHEQREANTRHNEPDEGGTSRFAVRNDHIGQNVRNDFRGIGRAEEIGRNAPIHKAAVLVKFSGFAPVIKNPFNAGRQRTDLCIVKVKLRVD